MPTAAVLAVITWSAADAQDTAIKTIATLDLSKPFATTSPWYLVATQGPATKNSLGDSEPGDITLCLVLVKVRRCPDDVTARSTVAAACQGMCQTAAGENGIVVFLTR